MRNLLSATVVVCLVLWGGVAFGANPAAYVKMLDTKDGEWAATKLVPTSHPILRKVLAVYVNESTSARGRLLAGKVVLDNTQASALGAILINPKYSDTVRVTAAYQLDQIPGAWSQILELCRLAPFESRTGEIVQMMLDLQRSLL